MTLIYSCTSDENGNDDNIRDERYVVADYIQDTDFLYDLTVNENGDAFYYTEDGGGIESQSLKMINNNGNKKSLLTINHKNEMFSGLAYFKNNELLLLKNSMKKSTHEIVLKYNYKSNTSTKYKIPYYGNPSIFERGMRSLSAHNNDNILIFDYSLKTIRDYSLKSRTSKLILPADSFTEITDIKTYNNTIYIVDNSILKKITKSQSNEYEVSNLSAPSLKIGDMTIDELGIVYVHVYEKGIFKLNNNKLEKYLTGELWVSEDFNHIISDFKSFNDIEIIKDILFISDGRRLIKISNYKDKFFK